MQAVALRYRDARGEPTTAATYGDESFLASFWRICGEPGLRVDVVVAMPLPARGRHRRELAREAETLIRRELALQGDASGPGTRAGPAATAQ